MNKYILTLAMIQVMAWAQSDDEIDPDDYDMMDDEDETDAVEELLTTRSAWRFQLPRGSQKYPQRYFGKDFYQHDSDADEKLAQLWEMLVPDESVVEEPTPFFWKEFDDFFQNKASGPFCNPGDELRRNRTKTSHT